MNEKLTAYALNELPPDERAELEAQMKDDPKLREEAEAMKAFCAMLETEVHASTEDTLDPEQRSKLVQTFQSAETKVICPPLWRRAVFFNGLGLAAAACVALMFAFREVKEASQSAKDLQQDQLVYKGAPDAAVPVKHPSEDVKVVRAHPTKPAIVTRTRRTTAVDTTPDIVKASPVPATPPLVGSGPLAPTDSYKKEGANNLWFSKNQMKTDSATLDLDSGGRVAAGGSTSNSTLTLGSADASPTGAAKAKKAEPPVVATGSFSKANEEQTASPALNINGNPPAVALNSLGSVGPSERPKATPVAGPMTGQNTYVGGTSTNGGNLATTTPAGTGVTAASPADPYSTAARRDMQKVEREKAQQFDAARDQTRTKMLDEVNQGWKEPPITAGNLGQASAPSPKASAMTSKTNAAAVASTTTAAPPDPFAARAPSVAEPIPAKPYSPTSTAAAAGAAPAPTGERAENGLISPDSVDGLITNKTLIASADKIEKVQKDDFTAKDRDALAKEAAELKKQIEEMSTRSYRLSVQEAQRRILEEKLLQDRLANERRHRVEQQYLVEQQQRARYGYNTATYRPIVENPFSFVAQEPLSTFSTDVDTASYANVRRFLNANQRPPGDAIRLEELINYFPYAYPAPEDDKPLAVKVDIGEAPWQPLHRLVRIAIKARDINKAERPAANFTFLLDVSGSMSPPERLPLVKKALRLLVDQLREDDRVSIVTYAGESGLALESTAGNEKEKIREAIDRLNAEGSTNGAGGIRMAYEQAVSHYKKDGINRIILCTDGDFNVGTSNVEELKALITEKAKTGVYLSVLGVGTDNLHDFTMQTLADCGNGNYHYLDSMGEARKVLVEQMTGNMITVAKDVKIQVEFNPGQVAAYRLIGYEKRMLEKEDFNNDKKDAGDIGAGHTITAFYEIVPADLKYPDGKPLVDDLKYDKPAAAAAEPPAKAEVPAGSKETMTVKLRYKEPNQDKSKLMTLPVTDTQKKLSENDRDFQFATSVAGFGMLLRGSPYGNELTWDTVRQLALSGKGDDEQGWRGEFIQLIEKARGICEK